MKVKVLSWSEVDLDINEEKIAEELHNELDRQIEFYGVKNVSTIDIGVNVVVYNLIQRELDKKDIEFEDYEIMD